MHDTFNMLFVELMNGTPLLHVFSTSDAAQPYSVPRAHNVTDGMKDHKLEMYSV
jgi:hypothetical protein